MSESHSKLSFFVVNPNDEHYGRECRIEPPTQIELSEGRVLATFEDGVQQEYTNGQRRGSMPEIAHLGTSESHGLAYISERLQAVRKDMAPLYVESGSKDWASFHSIMARVLGTEPINPEIDNDHKR